MTEREMLRVLADGSFEKLFDNVDASSISWIKNIVNEIPSQFFEPRIMLNEENRKISLIQFSLETVGMGKGQKNGLMKKYNINPYDMKKLQSIIDSIKVAQDYSDSSSKESNPNDNRNYGFALSSNDRLSKAYPLWVAYMLIDSKNPLNDVKAKLKEDGVEDKYSPETIVGLIEHTNSLMNGKSSEEKKDFYLQSISGILGGIGDTEITDEKIEVEI